MRLAVESDRSMVPTEATLRIEMALPSAANLREHWRVRAKRVHGQRAAVSLLWRSERMSQQIPNRWLHGGLVVTLTRYGRKLDSDNLQGAFKAVRDQVAAELGVDDGDESMVRWEYRQEKGKPAIEIRVS